MKTVLLVDLSGLWRMNWHASEDQELGAAYSKTVEAVRSLASRYSYTAICLDVPPYNRKKKYPEYKAQREAPTPQMLEQFTRVKERLVADGHLLWGAPGYEADDIIATAVRLAPRDGDTEIFIASSDKDLLTLVREDDVFAISFRDINVLIDAKAVAEKFGVPPALMGDLLALWGDKSDNLPGIDGVGPKKAASLLEQFGSFEDVLERASEIKTPALRESVIRGAAGARITRSLVALATDAPINFSEIYEKREIQPLTTSTNSIGFDDADFEPAARDEASAEPAELDQELESIAARDSNAVQERKPEPKTQIVRSSPSAIAPPSWDLALEPTTLGLAYKLAQDLYNSRLYSRFPSPEAIFAVIIRGREMGLGALTSLDLFHIVEGKPCPHAHFIIARAKASSECEYLEFVGGDATYAEWEGQSKQGAAAKRDPIKLRYTIEQAKKAGLVKPGSNWDKRPDEMLRKTGGVQLGRVIAPGATMGLYSQDEMAA